MADASPLSKKIKKQRGKGKKNKRLKGKKPKTKNIVKFTKALNHRMLAKCYRAMCPLYFQHTGCIRVFMLRDKNKKCTQNQGDKKGKKRRFKAGYITPRQARSKVLDLRLQSPSKRGCSMP